MATRSTRGAISLSSSSHLPAIVGSEIGETGDVAARPRKARDEAAADRIGNARENDGDGARLLQQRRRGWAWYATRIRSGCSATSSLRESLPRLRVERPAQRMSIRMLRPSAHPSFWSPSRNAATAGLCFRVALGKRPSARRSAASAPGLRCARPRKRAAAERRDESRRPCRRCTRR